MLVLELARKYAFWTKDFLKGSPVRKHYNDIKSILENPDSKKNIDRRKKLMDNVLSHARKTVPFYMSIEGNTLNSFKIIDKGVVRDNYEAFKSSQFINEKNTPVVTSGSTGTPFKLFHNENKRNRNKADVIYFAKKGGFEIGSRLFFMKVWNSINKKSNFKLFAENIKPYKIFNYANEDIAKILVDLKNDKSKKGIVCFASTCDVIANYLDEIKSGSLDYNVTSIIANSDALSNHTKDRMEKYFHIPVLSRYSNMECGMLAQQSAKSGYAFEINWASYHVELLKIDEDIPAELGEMGRVVITDLFNYCMPLIRYETGDLAYFTTNKNGYNVRLLERIEGRKIDLVYDSEGKVITSHIVTVNMWKYSELRQYQFVQKDVKRYTFILNPWTTFSKEEELIKEFKSYFGQDAIIDIEYVNEIPLLKSGKRKLVVNAMETKILS